MQPQQTTPPQPNFDFIMNPQQPTKHSPLGGGSSMATRILVVVGGLFVLAIIAAIFMRFLGSGGAFDKAAMLTVIQDQTEIARLATTGQENSVSQENKNFSVTAKLSLQSDQKILLTYLAEKGYKPNPKTFVLKQSAATDKTLADAKSSSTFDTAYRDIMEKALTTYRQDLSTAYDGASDSTKEVLQKQYDSAGLLITQLTGKTAAKQ